VTYGQSQNTVLSRAKLSYPAYSSGKSKSRMPHFVHRFKKRRNVRPASRRCEVSAVRKKQSSSAEMSESDKRH